MIVSYLPNPVQHPLWESIKALLKPAADFGDIPIRDDDELVWIAFEGTVLFAAATTLLWDDGEAELRLAGGYRHRDWIQQMDEVVSKWARDAGASRLTMRGRRGWTRYAARFGWEPLGTEDGRQLYEKVL